MIPQANQLKSQKHIHSIVRSHYTTNKKSVVYKCADPYCMYQVTIPRSNKSLLIGRISQCPKCRDEFTLSAQDLQRRLPVCYKCSNTQEAKNRRRQEERMSNLLELVQKEDLGKLKVIDLQGQLPPILPTRVPIIMEDEIIPTSDGETK